MKTFQNFSIVQGWLKTAETLYDPFGEDDEDIQINQILDRHLRFKTENFYEIKYFLTVCLELVFNM